MTKALNILIAPLDWGLGHTTRCIPIIRFLQLEGHHVYVAANGIAAQLIKENFQDIQILPIENYNIQYAKSSAGFLLKIGQQIPKILSVIKKEHKWLQTIINDFKIDAIISDNRYGLYHSSIKNVILTHQVQIKSGLGTWIDAILLKIHCKLLERFDACWIVDQAEKPGLSFELAHPNKLPKKAKYIGWLSQFMQIKNDTIAQKQLHFLILLSGPEPMRTTLETILWQQCSQIENYTFCFVAGKPGIEKPKIVPIHIEWHSHLNAPSLLQEILKAKAVICRSGYSTLMDLKILNRPALLIPTPGQTEQEYLAQQLSIADPDFILKTQENVVLKNDIGKLLYATTSVKNHTQTITFENELKKWLYK